MYNFILIEMYLAPLLPYLVCIPLITFWGFIRTQLDYEIILCWLYTPLTRQFWFLWSWFSDTLNKLMLQETAIWCSKYFSILLHIYLWKHFPFIKSTALQLMHNLSKFGWSLTNESSEKYSLDDSWQKSSSTLIFLTKILFL